jgi:putative glutamine amidotransferase
MPAVPLIGITAGHLPSGHRTMDGADREYGRAVVLAGGAPVLLPTGALTEMGAVVSRLDGLVLSGGGDVEPERYGAVRARETGGVDPERDAAEMAYLTESLDRGLPVLAVCRGCQLVNVALGGTLRQHLPDVTGLPHLLTEPRNRISHTVAVERDSLLHAVVGRDLLEVNSIHHQAVDRPAAGLRVTGCAPDGTVEAVEDAGRRLLAVQWHPESLVPDEPSLALFEWITGRRSGA